MPNAPSTFRPPWNPRAAAKAETARYVDERRGSARSRGYDSKWEKARLAYLARHPLCVSCWANGVAHPAKVLDHIEPHKGDKAKFWNSANWQGICEWCDKNLKRSIENRWLSQGGPVEVLRIDRKVPGWEHPARR